MLFSLWFLLILPDIADVVFAVDGNWSDWWEWEPCSASCGKGIRRRFRLCNNPPPSDGGANCEGKRIEKQECRASLECPTDGRWSEWTIWTQCTVTCGEGTMTRSRKCDSPPSANGGRDCEGNEIESITCIPSQHCPADPNRDGEWSSWGQWSSCSVTCGGFGSMTRRRSCNNPSQSPDRKNCRGINKQMKRCKGPSCSVDGGWGEWTEWTQCTMTCGEGTTTRFRECDSPPPAIDGKDCEGSEVETIACVTQDCSRDGEWSSWGQWSSCSVTCGGFGSMTRRRSCNNPPPSDGGKDCPGSNNETQRCRAPGCPVNGHWSEWSAWSHCSVTCGTGVQNRRRKCDNPPPQNGGLDCSTVEAGEKQQLNCNGSIVFCPVNGGWSDWGEWGECYSLNCASTTELSYKIKERTCNSPHPAHKGSMCQGTFLAAGVCENPVNCPVDGVWSEWSNWICQRTSVTRTRKCNNPAPANGGKQCVGEKAETYIDEDDEYQKLCPDFEDREEEDEDIEGNNNGDNLEDDEKQEYDDENFDEDEEDIIDEYDEE